jgi:hypothetical protein
MIKQTKLHSYNMYIYIYLTWSLTTEFLNCNSNMFTVSTKLFQVDTLDMQYAEENPAYLSIDNICMYHSKHSPHPNI